ncbi:MAG TPA: hypothetical protein VER55_04710, partial [Ardenticatenaceae bacterium]|nr:hypothetical protein [Ardenticatenaceae bacterium]
DVADTQLVLTHWGEPADASRPLHGPSFQEPAQTATFTVDSDQDDPDADTGDGLCRTRRGVCTLRAAIEQSNVRPGREVIQFDVGDCPDLVTIEPTERLTIDDADGSGITINGYSQCGASPNSRSISGNAQIKVEIRGPGTEDVDGLVIASSNNVIRGLSIYNFDSHIYLQGTATYNNIRGNFIGTNPDNTFFRERPGDDRGKGLIIYGGTNNIVGCGSYEGNEYVPCASQAQYEAARNIISGNGADGVHFGASAAYNRIVGNYIGLKQDGVTALPNATDGIDINSGPNNNWIGGLSPGERNVISGNGSDGIEVSHSSTTRFNHLAGNYWGVDARGRVAVPNERDGISLEDGVDSNYVYNNVVSGNGRNGIRLYILTTRSQVYDNLIGVAVDGETAIPNGTMTYYESERNGMHILGGAQHNLIRTNVIANNVGHGIRLSNWSESTYGGYGEAYFNTISRNSMSDNGLTGIHFAENTNPETGEQTYPNQNMPEPWIEEATPVRVAGSACGGCVVEVFIADKSDLDDPSGENWGEGKTFIGAGAADPDGDFVVAVAGVEEGQLVTATATDAFGNTSRFARNVLVGAVPPSPTPTRTPSTTPSATGTLSPTATGGAAGTATATASTTPRPSLTGTATATGTVSPEATRTPTSAATASSTGTATATATAGASETMTPTATGTAPASATATPTVGSRVQLPLIVRRP